MIHCREQGIVEVDFVGGRLVYKLYVSTSEMYHPLLLFAVGELLLMY